MTTRIRIFLLIIAAMPAICSPVGAVPIPKNILKPFINSHKTTVDSVMLHYRVWITKVKPSKGKVLFIHGFTGSTFSFRKNYDSLVNAGYNILAVDLPAFGYSDRGTWINHSQSSRAVMIWKLIDGKRSSRDIALAFMKGFQDAPHSVCEDVMALLDSLAEDGLIGRTRTCIVMLPKHAINL